MDIYYVVDMWVDCFVGLWVKGDVGDEMFVYYIDMYLVGILIFDCVDFLFEIGEICGQD